MARGFRGWLAVPAGVALAAACAEPPRTPAPLPPAPSTPPLPPPAPSPVRIAATPLRLADDFSSPDLRAEYVLSASPGTSVLQTKGLLRMVAPTPVTFADAHVVVAAKVRPPLVATVRIRLGAQEGSEGSSARIQLVDGDTWINFGIASPAGLYRQDKQQGTFTHRQIPGTALDDRWHEYRIAYDGSAARMFYDGVLVATVPIELRTAEVWLQTLTHYRQPGTALGEFDDLSIIEGWVP